MLEATFHQELDDTIKKKKFSIKYNLKSAHFPLDNLMDAIKPVIVRKFF